MFKTSLICTDFSDGLHRLVEFVPDLTHSGLQRIVFLHCVSLRTEGEIPRVDTSRIEKARDRLSRALQNVPAGVEVHIEVETGPAPETILRMVETYKPDVLILGTPTRTLLNERLFGSTTIELSQRTEVPILSLRPQLISTYTREELALRCRHLFRYLLLPYNGTKTADYLIDRFKHYLQQRPAGSIERCRLLWIVETGRRTDFNLEGQLKAAQDKLNQVKADLEGLDVIVETEVRQGEPILGIMETAQVQDISAIAVSSRRANWLVDLSGPSLGCEVLRRCWHPVLIFSPAR